MSAIDTLRWAHVGLNCRDQAATEEFYTRWFGFRRARLVTGEGWQVVFLRRGEAWLELFGSDAEPAPAAKDDGPANPGTVRHLAFQVDDVDAFLAEANGELPISLGPLGFDEYIPGWRTVWVQDPDGVVIEVSQGYTDQSAEELRQQA
ncbi:VOC family protein [Kitasatospora sp. LaBMicrA B282]|uniref:VOC family protein n=1 Tax=Kitasatospora sp. LaBMicrA B282 TaxID=3420949 RepID=UPI003D0A38F6